MSIGLSETLETETAIRPELAVSARPSLFGRGKVFAVRYENTSTPVRW
jgi:hypothetical protein